MGLLSLSKKLVYTGNMNDLKPKHNKAMAHMNLMNLYKEKCQDVQEFRDQYVAMKNVCNKLAYLLVESKKMPRL